MRLRAIIPLTVFCVAICALPLLAQPSIHVVGGDTVDWGRTGPGQLKREVQVVNVGTAQLKIDRVQPSCGCTTAPLDKTELEPGDTARLSVSINMQNSSGRQMKYVTIYSNDSSRATLRMLLTADIVRDLTVTPGQFPTLLNGTLDSTITSTVQLTNTGDEVVLLETPVVKELNGLTVMLDPLKSRSLKPGESLALLAHITPKAEGVLGGTVVVKTSSRNMPEISIPIHGVVRKLAAVVPAASGAATAVKSAKPTASKSRKLK